MSPSIALLAITLLIGSAAAQSCTTSYTCPLDKACIAGKCQSGSVVGWGNVPTEGRARQCKSQSDCLTNLENISADFTCTNGVCVIAGIGKTCTSGPTLGSDTCGAGTVCENGKCVPGTRGKKCNDNVGACDGGLWCEFWKSKTCTTKRAGQNCKGKYDCPRGLACTGGVCTIGDAGAFCVAHGHCKNGLYCVDQKCATPLAAFGGAGAGSCTTSYTCPLNSACVGGKCQKGSVIGWNKVPTEGRARQCKSKGDCLTALENISADYSCTDGVCVIGGIGQTCTSGSAVGSDTCGPGLVCEGGKCAAGTRGKKCNDFVGTCGDGLWCEFWKSKTCTTKRAGRQCKGMYDCPKGIGCVGGICTLGSNGSFCVAHAHCKEGLYCVEKKCTTPLAAFA